MRPSITDVLAGGVSPAPHGDPAFVGGTPGGFELLVIQVLALALGLWFLSIVVRTVTNLADGYARGREQETDSAREE